MMRARQMAEDGTELYTFDNITEEEIISLWHSFKLGGLSESEAWDAIVTGIALDMAFDRTKNLRPVVQ